MTTTTMWHTHAPTSIISRPLVSNISNTTWYHQSTSFGVSYTPTETPQETTLTSPHWPQNTSFVTPAYWPNASTSKTFANTSTLFVNKPAPTIIVTVGVGGRLTFSPETVSASIGTTLLFDFLSLNHTLTQSEFSNPCRANGHFDTGFRQFNPANMSGKFLVPYEVTSNKPQWFFCAQTFRMSHCQAGMVFSLNSGQTSHQQFLRNALSAASSKYTSACYGSNIPTPASVSASVSASPPIHSGLIGYNGSRRVQTPTAIDTQLANSAISGVVNLLLYAPLLAFFFF